MNRGSFNDFISSIFKRSGWLSGGAMAPPRDAQGLIAMCRDLLDTGGEASAISFAARILEGYEMLGTEDRLRVFQDLARDFDLDPGRLVEVTDAYSKDPGPAQLAQVIAVAEPARQELFRRLNMAPGGTATLVKMRSDLLRFIEEDENLKRVDADFRHLLSSWFNRGFLLLRPIDWHTSADVLEKVIAYEAVHEIEDWHELRRRLQPDDRRCFAFFHPAMPDDPLIFVEVALTTGIPMSIQSVLASDRSKLTAEKADTAVFYSISNCQPGLAGVSFGNLLIKQVAADLKALLPNLSTFVTLSPIPGLCTWLARQADEEPLVAQTLLALEQAGSGDGDGLDALTPALTKLAAQYFLSESRPDGNPLDPVARFHLGNGAELHRILPMADLSQNGLRQSGGLMANYLYDLDAVERRHETYARTGKVMASSKVRALLRQQVAVGEDAA